MAGVKSSLYYRNRSGGKIAVEDQKYSTGDRYWVHSGTGTDGTAYGFSPDKPFATIDYAVGKCTASKYDQIFVMPYHAENLTTATSLAADVIGISIVGIGEGNAIPTLSHTLLAGCVTISVANVTLRNLRFKANIADGVTHAIDVAAGGDGVTIDGCQFRETANTKEFLVNIDVATTVTDATIKNCDIIQLSGGSATNAILFAGTTSDLVLENNRIQADCTDSVVDHLAGAATNCLIKDNILYNEDDQTAGYTLDFHASSTGLAVGNRGAYNKVDAAMTKGAAMWWIENYFSNTIAESGLIEPATSHAIP